MIFVTVGTQLPFDRLIRAMDTWAGQGARHDVIAQTAQGEYSPHHLRCVQMLSPVEFKATVRDCDLLVAHAGIGSILSALEIGKPVIVLPREAQRGEHRNDHQLATARRFSARGLVRVAQDETELCQMLNQFETPQSQTRIPDCASPELIGRLRDFIAGSPVSRTRNHHAR